MSELKSVLETIKAKAGRAHNLQDYYKWSIAAGLTGVLGGLGGALFNFILDGSLWGFNKLLVSMPDPRFILLIPAIGGLLAGITRYVLLPEAFESCCSTDAMIDIVHKDGGKTRWMTPFATIISSALTIGSGGSAGRECPTALIGTGFGSISSSIIQKLKLDKIFKFSFTDKDIRTLAICGAAAGIGAIFRAPIGAAIFSISVLYVYGMELDALLPALISSITAYLIFSTFYGFESLFKAPFAWSFNMFDLFWISLIGVVTSLAGVLYIKVFYGIFHAFRKLSVPDYLKPAIGGLIVGIIVLFFPRVFGMGYETIQDAIDYKIAATVLIAIIVAKMFATSFSIGSGGSGGVIAPSLFIGAAIGGSMGRLAIFLFPHAAVHPALYVVVAMGAFFSAIGKTPLATAILLSEATRNFTMIVPLIAGNTASFLAASTHTIYESQHAEVGDKGDDMLRRIRVKDIMQPQVMTVPLELSAADFIKKVQQTGHHGFPVVDHGNFRGMVFWDDVRVVPQEERETTRISELMRVDSADFCIYPNKTAGDLLKIFDDKKVDRALVMNPTTPGKLIGIVTRQDVINNYLKAG